MDLTKKLLASGGLKVLVRVCAGRPDVTVYDYLTAVAVNNTNNVLVVVVGRVDEKLDFFGQWARLMRDTGKNHPIPTIAAMATAIGTDQFASQVFSALDKKLTENPETFVKYQLPTFFQFLTKTQGRFLPKKRLSAEEVISNMNLLILQNV